MTNIPFSTESTIADLEGQLRRWHVAPKTTASNIAALQHLTPLIAHLLIRRGITTSEEADVFLETRDLLFQDPATLPDIDRATARIRLAREQGETVAVYGDFDADGVTGTALMVIGLRHYGLDVVSYIPHRITEGHGLNFQAIDYLHQQGVRLIITVDCGVTDVEQISHAKQNCVDTIITDHHLTADHLPDAAAIINPHAPHSEYAFEHLTGVGMVLKLSQALLEPELGDDWANGLMELAAIGTITDLAPLLGENRYIVNRGLRYLAQTSSIGLRALMESARVDTRHVNADTIGFSLGPRINAAGRLDHADIALELLTTVDSEHAKSLVDELDHHNTQRRQLTDETLDQSRKQLPAIIPPLVAVGSPDFHPGVVGLVAGRLSEELATPTLCYAEDEDLILASCRGAPGFHWADALNACDDLLLRHGGHAQAAGFTCKSSLLPAVTERLQAIASEQIGDTKRSTDGFIDAEVMLGDLMGPTFQMLRKMEPFGVGNPAPLFLSRGLEVLDARTMGAAATHFRLKLATNGSTWDGVAFRQSWVNGTKYVDIVFTMDIAYWKGKPRVQLMIRDYAPSTQPTHVL